MNEPAPLEWQEAGVKMAIALGLGLLVGLQRERVQSQLAGIRTFALLTVFGTVCGLLDLRLTNGSRELGGWITAAGALTVAALLVTGNAVQRRAKRHDPGLTTEVAVLLMYGVGAYLVVGHAALAIAVGGGTALLLHFKEPMHDFVARIGENDLKAIMQFVLIALVILPVLPDQTYGPYEVLNPFQIWLMVVLIVGINLAGYLAYKLVGSGASAVLGGVLGGLVSSTATTVSYARRTKDAVEAVGLAALVIVIASAIAYGRVLVEIAVTAPEQFRALAPPLGVMLAVTAGLALPLYLTLRREQEQELPPQANPAELKQALFFGGLYAVILLAIAAAKDYLGDSGLYGVAILSGLHDMDAITLSTSRLVAQELLDADLGWRAILVASLSNLAMKWVFVAFLGHRRLTLRVAGLFGIVLVAGAVLLAAWPTPAEE